MQDTRYYCVHVSQRGKVSLRWGPPLPRPSEAAARGRALIAQGEASAAFVVRAAGDERTVVVSYTQPPAARKLIEHYEELMEATGAYEE